MPNLSKRIHHGLYEVHLPVTSVDRSIAFYVEKLDFELGFRKSESSALLLCTEGGSRWMLGVWKVDKIHRIGPADYHLAFRVAEEDVDQMVPYLRGRGIEPIHPPAAPIQGPMEEPIVHGWMPAASVFFRDPDGHLLELIADLHDKPRPEVLYEPWSRWKSSEGD